MPRKKNEEQIEDTSKMLECTVEEVLHNSMIPFSEHVIMDRAIPRIEDGLKPVQRRILYTMSQLGITPDKPFVKSARVVGDCLGKYHPHGDSSVYDAMVRLAQSFNVRMPLVSGQGNYGSVDGDGAAAMRYTEAKLAPLAMELLRDLDKNTVKMVLNFDDTLEEPDLLPGRFPNLLVNGSSGIAVGMSTNIPTHNLGEVIDGVVAYIDNSKITLDEMMQYISAPDFPTGALIIKSEGIRDAYKTGKGKVIMRAKATIEKDGDKDCIVITEIPFQVNKAELLKRINSLRETKKDLYGGIQDINDESNRDGIRCVIKIKKEANAKRILAGLFKSTQLESAFNVNMMAIADGKPEQLSLLGYISRYVEFQREVIFKRSEYDLTAASNRAHILEGLLIAVNNIRRVVDIVLSSPTYEESKETLRKEFNLTDKQATAVLDIPLKRLNRLDVHKMEEELAELKKKIAELQSILESRKKQLNIVKKELLEIKAKYANPRLTQIVDEAEHPQMIKAEEIIEAHLVSGYVLLNYQGTLRFLTDKSYKMATKNIVNCSVNELVKTAIKVNGDEKLIAFTKNGQACVFSVDMLTEDKWKSKGTMINKLGKLDSDDAIVALFSEAQLKGKSLYFATKNGMIKKTQAEEYPMDKKNTAPAIILKDDEVISVEIVDDKAEYILFVTELGNVLNAYADVPEQGRRSAGVKGIKLNEKDKVKYVAQNYNEGEIVVILASGIAKRVILPTIEPKNRYGKGVTLCDVTKPKELAFVSLVTNPYDFAIFFVDGDIVAVNTDDVDIEARTSKGKNLLKKVAKKKYESVIYAVYSHNLI
ncbi:MAG: DNA topoisomerase 4 subunit A [Clostridia bacterium]|nr:DNA topoisomerase 4 subunit A [Clostridia bacterium]